MIAVRLSCVLWGLVPVSLSEQFCTACLWSLRSVSGLGPHGRTSVITNGIRAAAKESACATRPCPLWEFTSRSASILPDVVLEGMTGGTAARPVASDSPLPLPSLSASKTLVSSVASHLIPSHLISSHRIASHCSYETVKPSLTS